MKAHGTIERQRRELERIASNYDYPLIERETATQRARALQWVLDPSDNKWNLLTVFKRYRAARDKRAAERAKGAD